MFESLRARIPYTASLNRVRRVVKLTEGSETLTLKIDADATRLMHDLNRVKDKLQEVSRDDMAADKDHAAYLFAAAIFGDTQAKQLIDFYGGDPDSVIDICGKIFSGLLVKEIARVQKKARVK